jgi:uncharacterized SAM-binding protein YcdF (DUF218 family)
MKNITKKIFYLILFSFIACLILMIILVPTTLIQHSQNYKIELQHYIDQPDYKPDLIIVYTGQKGRLSEGFQLASLYPNAQILISGVNHHHSAYSLSQLTDLENYKNKSKNKDHLIEQLSLDYQSKNTIENVYNTLIFLKQNPQFKEIVIISHDYHLYRIQMIFQQLLNNSHIEEIHLPKSQLLKKSYSHPWNILFYPVKSQFLTWHSQKIYMKEMIKILRTWWQLTIKEREEIQNGKN